MGRFEERYEILSEVGRGGMGVVYRAKQRSLNRVVAVKMLSRELATDPEFLQRFQQEAQVIARLQHDNIISVHDIESDNGSFYIIMEFVEGQSLQEVLRRNGRLPIEQVVRLIGQVARALGYAHSKGIIHRDIKPDNIMIVNDGQKAMVMDFGIARVADSSLKTQTGISMGTPKYMSPEQARGQHVDARSDLYSLGVVLFAALTGDLPFDGDSPFTVALKHIQEPPPLPSERVPDLPASLEDVVLRSMAKSPKERYQTGEELALALEEALEKSTEIFSATASGRILDKTEMIQTQVEPSTPADAEKDPIGSSAPFDLPTPAPSVAQQTPAGGRSRGRILAISGAVAAVAIAAVAVLVPKGSAPTIDAPAVVATTLTPVAATPSPTPEITPSPTPATPPPTPTPRPRIPVEALTGEAKFGNPNSPAAQAIKIVEGIKQAYEKKFAAGGAMDEGFVDEQARQLARLTKTIWVLERSAQQNPIVRNNSQSIQAEMKSLMAWLNARSQPEAKRLFDQTRSYLGDEDRGIMGGLSAGSEAARPAATPAAIAKRPQQTPAGQRPPRTVIPQRRQSQRQ